MIHSFKRLFWLLCGKWIVVEWERVIVDIQEKDGWWLG